MSATSCSCQRSDVSLGRSCCVAERAFCGWQLVCTQCGLWPAGLQQQVSSSKVGHVDVDIAGHVAKLEEQIDKLARSLFEPVQQSVDERAKSFAVLLSSFKDDSRMIMMDEVKSDVLELLRVDISESLAEIVQCSEQKRLGERMEELRSRLRTHVKGAMEAVLEGRANTVDSFQRIMDEGIFAHYKTIDTLQFEMDVIKFLVQKGRAACVSVSTDVSCKMAAHMQDAEI